MVGGQPPPTTSSHLWVLLCIWATLLKDHSYFLAGVDVRDLAAVVLGCWSLGQVSGKGKTVQRELPVFFFFFQDGWGCLGFASG